MVVVRSLFIYLKYPVLEYNSYGDTLLHSATHEKDTKRVQALIKMGAKTRDTTTIAIDGQIFTNATAIHIAILKRNPEMLALMLQAKDSDSAMDMKCKEGKDFSQNATAWTTLQLAMWIEKQGNENNTFLVSN